MIEFFNTLNPLSVEGIFILIFAGFLVGFINTIAGSGSAITYSLFMLMGLPAGMANGTIRIGVIMQTLMASWQFKKHKVLPIKEAIWLALPTIIGTIVGAQIAVSIPTNILEISVGCIMLVLLFFLFKDPKKWLKKQTISNNLKQTWRQYILFFIIGLYGGFIHIGVGIFLLSALVLNAGYDMVKANSIKVFIVLLYSPFALLVFIYNQQVDFSVGLIAAIGNLFGGMFASKIAIYFGPKFIRAFLAIIIILFTAKLFNPHIL